MVLSPGVFIKRVKMQERVLIFIAIALFIATGLLAKNRKTTSIESFSTLRNRLSWFVTAAGVSMTFLGGAALLNIASLGYRYKWYTLIDPFAFIIGIIISVVLVKNYRNDTGITISQLVSGSNRRLSLYVGFITSVVFLMVISAQFVAFSKLLAPYFPGVSTALLVTVPSGFVLLYVFLGGFAAVTNTDILQLFFMFLFLLIPVGYYAVIQEPAVPEPVLDNSIFAPMPGELIIYLFISAVFIPLSQDVNIRAKSAKNARHARRGLIFGAIFYALVVVACGYIGVTLAEHGIKIADNEQAFPTFFKQFYPTFGIFPILAGMAAIWSTLDTYLVNCITAVAQDILKNNNYFKKQEDRKLVIVAGIIVFSIATCISLYFNQVLSLILIALLVYISVLLPVAIGKKIKMNDDLIFFISLVTVIAIILCEIMNVELTPKAVMYPAASFLLMLGGSLYRKLAINTRSQPR